MQVNKGAKGLPEQKTNTRNSLPYFSSFCCAIKKSEDLPTGQAKIPQIIFRQFLSLLFSFVLLAFVLLARECKKQTNKKAVHVNELLLKIPAYC